MGFHFPPHIERLRQQSNLEWDYQLPPDSNVRALPLGVAREAAATKGYRGKQPRLGSVIPLHEPEAPQGEPRMGFDMSWRSPVNRKQHRITMSVAYDGNQTIELIVCSKPMVLHVPYDNATLLAEWLEGIAADLRKFEPSARNSYAARRERGEEAQHIPTETMP